LASRVPRYHQIAQTLRERIATSGQGPGERLDNQRSLAREFGVTLMTLRQALDLLEHLLKVPYDLSPGWLRIDPNFAPLKGNPRFERLVTGV